MKALSFPKSHATASQLQFRLMTPEAQRAAVQRLALRGWDANRIGSQVGLQEADVQGLLHGGWPAGEYPHLRQRGDRFRIASTARGAS